MSNVASAKKPVVVPAIDGVSGKIATIERRINYLKERLSRSPSYSQSDSANFDRAEIPALEAAVLALRYVETVN